MTDLPPNAAEQQSQNSGTSEPEEKNTPKTDEAEFERANAALERMKALDEEAQSMGFNSHEEMVEYLQEREYSRMQNENDDNQQPPAQPKAEPKPKESETPSASKVNEEMSERLKQAINISTKAALDSQFLLYKTAQSSLSDDEKLEFSRVDLDKIISGPKGRMVIEISKDPDFDGNVYAAAAHYKAFIQGKSAIRQQGANAEKARQKAEQTASPPTSQAIKNEENLDPAKKMEEDFLNRIAPDTRYKG